MILQEQILNEIKQVPNDKLAEIYDLIHYYRIGLEQEKKINKLPVQKRSVGLFKGKFEIPKSFFEPLPDDIINSFEGN